MEGADRAGDDRTFKISFGGEGTSRLREKVKEKLKEVMGDYTDDTLVDYVLVLLRNGRTKEEARRELDVFLGDDSVSFVSWLWDHLSLNFHLYAQPKEVPLEDIAKSNKDLDDHRGRQSSKTEYMLGDDQTDSEKERESLSRSRSRRNSDWKGLIQEGGNSFPLRSTVSKILHSEKTNTSPNVKRSLSPKPQSGRKRVREDGRQPMKRDAAPNLGIGASRRLLEFAVRDAVRTVQQASSRAEPALKRLRSVVATSTEDSFWEEKPQRLRSVARLPGALSTALKAAAEAAEDVTKDRRPPSVFDRLSHGASVVEPTKQSSVEPMLEDEFYADPDLNPDSTHAEYYVRGTYHRDLTGDTRILERNVAMRDESASDNDGYNNITRNQGLYNSQSAAFANKDKKAISLQYSVAQDSDEVVRHTRLIDQDQTSSQTTKALSKIAKGSVNINTWKPPHQQIPTEAGEAKNQMTVEKTDINAAKTTNRHPNENDTAVLKNEIARPEDQKETQKAPTSTPGSYTTSRPSDDVDSRTVVVSNVHYAATKDSLSRHFNKFGEVLKVIIVSDAATGQPKGLAYVEFLRKESAESALSLSGKSFMSRSLKVARKSSMHHEVATVMSWPRIARAPMRFNRAAFSRGVLTGAYRGRLPLKVRARSLQWKREGSTTAEGVKGTQSASMTSGNNVPSPTGRNLTYIRPESKVDASSGPA